MSGAERSCECVVGPVDADGHVQRASRLDPWVVCGKTPARLVPYCSGPAVALPHLCEEHEALVPPADREAALARLVEVLQVDREVQP